MATTVGLNEKADNNLLIITPSNLPYNKSGVSCLFNLHKSIYTVNIEKLGIAIAELQSISLY